MKSLKTRVATTALAGAMALSLAVPAFAVDPTTKVTATYTEIPIDVTVTPTVTTALNPMGMPVKLTVSASSDAKPEVTSAIANQPATIVNNTRNKLAVNATVTGAIKGNFKFATTAWDPEAETLPTANQGFVFLEAKNDTASCVDDDKAVDADKVAVAFAAWDDRDLSDLQSDDGVTAAVTPADDDTAAIVVLKASAVKSTKPIIVMDAGTENADDDTKTDPSVTLVRLGGQLVEDPKTAWTKADGFTASIAYTFKVVKATT